MPAPLHPLPQGMAELEILQILQYQVCRPRHAAFAALCALTIATCAKSVTVAPVALCGLAASRLTSSGHAFLLLRLEQEQRRTHMLSPS